MSDELDIPSPTYRVPRRSRGMDPGTRKLAIIAGCLGGALLLVIGGWSLMGRHGGPVPVIEADKSPLRVKPENPGGLQVGGTNDEILSDGAGTTTGKLAPGAETPDPQALKAPPPVAAAPAPPQPAAPLTPTTPAAPLPVASAPAPTRPAIAEHAVAPAKPPVAERAQAAHPSAGKGNTLVQLAALSSEEAAKQEWQRLEKRMPSLLDGRQPAVTKIERDGKTYWRLRTGGFADIAQATAFCEQVRAKGSGCSIASY
ncbi:MAG: SPOR domain-containing protein [Proteobacteria bacterium]|nr:SPOR domain-containing protein [Pseudomonadota bacterium]